MRLIGMKMNELTHRKFGAVIVYKKSTISPVNYCRGRTHSTVLLPLIFITFCSPSPPVFPFFVSFYEMSRSRLEEASPNRSGQPLSISSSA